MDWFTWLSKTSLEPSLVYEYGLSFQNNELEEDDISYFNHEFLQSIGISIAKHRLEILKLAKKEKNGTKKMFPHSMSRLVIAIKRTKMSLSKYLHRWIHGEESALAIVPRRSYSGSWKNSMLKRNKKLMVVNKNNNQKALLLTNGSPLFFASSRIDSFSSPMVHDFQRDDQKKDGDDYDEYWSSAVEEIRWDAMFQNLKPT